MTDDTYTDDTDQIQLARGVDRPMIGWECDNCEEPYNSRRKPQQHMCVMCREETVWRLPEDFKTELMERLWDAEVGDELVVVAEGPAPLKGEIIRVDGRDFVWFGPENDCRMVAIEDLRLHKDPQDYGHEIHLVQVNRDGNDCCVDTETEHEENDG